MSYYNLNQIIAIARSSSSYYASLYKDLPKDKFDKEMIPLAHFDTIMQVIHDNPRALFSSKDIYGMYYTTSGTTGRPKYTIFGHEEWKYYIKRIAYHHEKNGLIQKGDIICNLSEPGSASFMTMHGVVNEFSVPCSEIPIGCDVDYSRIYEVSQQFCPNVISGMNPTLLGYAYYIIKHHAYDKNIERILGGGELFFGSQRDLIKQAFPNARFCPFIYGAAEAGLIGYSNFKLKDSEFIPFRDICSVELIDMDTHKVITEPNKLGLLAVTNYIRTAAPVIRFLTGDLAYWVTPSTNEMPVFSLSGRLFSKKYKVGTTVFSLLDINEIIKKIDKDLRLVGFQVLLEGTQDETEIEVVISVFQAKIFFKDVKRICIQVFREVIPSLYSSEQVCLKSLRIRLKDFSYFVKQSKRKWKYIIDNRANTKKIGD